VVAAAAKGHAVGVPEAVVVELVAGGRMLELGLLAADVLLVPTSLCELVG
jgi:hypothetical protein